LLTTKNFHLAQGFSSQPRLITDGQVISFIWRRFTGFGWIWGYPIFEHVSKIIEILPELDVTADLSCFTAAHVCSCMHILSGWGHLFIISERFFLYICFSGANMASDGHSTGVVSFSPCCCSLLRRRGWGGQH
jgi:hypothetical protein